MARKKPKSKKKQSKENEQNLQELVELGFSRQRAQEALTSCYGDLQMATQLLFAEIPDMNGSESSSKRRKTKHDDEPVEVVDLSSSSSSGQSVRPQPGSSSSSSSSSSNSSFNSISPSKRLRDEAFQQHEEDEQKQFQEKKADGLRSKKIRETKLNQTEFLLENLQMGTNRLKRIVRDMPALDQGGEDVTTAELRGYVRWFHENLTEELQRQNKINEDLNSEIKIQVEFEDQMTRESKRMEVEHQDEMLARQFQREQQNAGVRMTLEDRNILILKNDYDYKKTYSCTICLDDDLDIKSILVISCGHYWCVNCLRRTFEQKIGDGLVGDILTCPNPDCETKIDFEEIQLSVSAPVFEKYERFLLEGHLKTDPDCRWCPKPGCNTAMLGVAGATMMRCPKCDAKFCFNCRTEEYHDGVTCVAFQKWKKENEAGDARFSTWVTKHSKMCPKCKVRIEKNGGCDHMTCRNCHYEFYWSNGKPFGKFKRRANQL